MQESRGSRESDSSLARVEVHQSYLIRGQTELSMRLAALESQNIRHDSIISTAQEWRSRLERVEEAIRLIKTAAGIMLMTMAANGAAGDMGERIGKMLLGLP